MCFGESQPCLALSDSVHAGCGGQTLPEPHVLTAAWSSHTELSVSFCFSYNHRVGEIGLRPGWHHRLTGRGKGPSRGPSQAGTLPACNSVVEQTLLRKELGLSFLQPHTQWAIRKGNSGKPVA